MPRELIDTGTDKRYVRRDKKGQFKTKTASKKGEGDKGDRKRKS
jgi:hypothetical protein